MLRDVVSNLKVKGNNFMDELRSFNDSAEEVNNNTIFQRYYGQSYLQFLMKNKVSFRSIITMRKQDDYRELLDTRAKMVDWMIEVLMVYSSRGSNEYTFFKALTIFDFMIDQKLVDVDTVHIYGIASLYLASNILDKNQMTIEDAF